MKGETLARPKALRPAARQGEDDQHRQPRDAGYGNDLPVAVLVQLEPSGHGDRYAGKWNLEAAFDELPYPPDKVFDSLDHAQRRLLEHLHRSEHRAP